MNYDFMVCNREDCAKKETCWRYHKYKQMGRLYDGFVTMYDPEKTPKRCTVYINIKDKYNEIKEQLNNEDYN